MDNTYFCFRTYLLYSYRMYIEIYGRIKFKNDKEKPIEPLIENEQSKKQDIDDF